ncbi:RHS repeat-associated core domain-containing protein [Kalamiella sp. sgz302252]|uniref:RHS repeat-associated core domain-containing protein n=1 Tax=Pantoea sp. sgz302252 TaxID=3341827 RepID=UPI0036D25CD6
MNPLLYSKTPVVTVIDNRGQSVRDIRYYRHPDTPDVTEEYLTRHSINARGALVQSIDARLYALQQTDSEVKPNFVYLHTLQNEPICTTSVDAGVVVNLNDIAGRPCFSITASATTRRWQYEDASLPGRPLSMTAQGAGEAVRTEERFIWAGNSPAEKANNLAGNCISHYDTAGLQQTESLSLTGVPLATTRRLLTEDFAADWQGTDVSGWNAMLAAERFTTQSTLDATGAPLTTIDAKGNVQRLAYDVAGLLSGSWLTLKGGAEQAILTSLTYSAAGQKLREEHGNGVVTTYRYEPETQRLTGMKTERPSGHAAGPKVLQDLRYEYDPVGNVLNLTNDAEQTRFWRNQKIVPENRYVYDSLYQLVSATGRERVGIGQQGASSPAVAPLASDSSAFTTYTRTYAYDSGGNLTQIRHSAPASGNSYTTAMTVSNRSNRAVLSTLTEDATKVDALFTLGGQQIALQPGQSLMWTSRGELLKVTPVVRDGQAADSESYRYDAAGQRISKISMQQSGNSGQTQRVVYLPGLELRTLTTGATEKERLHVISLGEAGRAQVRALHWEAGKPDDIGNDQLRYSYDNLLGSSGLEVDGNGSLISMEEYYPYGGTAVWMARSKVEADYKTVRYSGKERDATGLYYYGFRYYQPWAGRWLSADPAGTLDGLNLYRMVRNNPLSGKDEQGLFTLNPLKAFENYRTKSRANKSYQNMRGGRYWQGKIKDLDTLNAVSNENISRLKTGLGKLSASEASFSQRFQQAEFYLTHFSTRDFSENGNVTFRSRKELQKKGIEFSTENTMDIDIEYLKTDDFAFFSLGVGRTENRQSSRFGHIKYNMPLNKASGYKYMKYSHVQINDTLLFEQRTTSESTLNQIFSREDTNALLREKIASHPKEVVFSREHFKEGLALNIIRSARKLSPQGQEIILGAKDSEELDGALSLLYRPQFLVPKKLVATATMQRFL